MFKDSKLKLFKETSSKQLIGEFMIRTVSTVRNITNLVKNSHSLYKITRIKTYHRVEIYLDGIVVKCSPAVNS